MNQVIESDVRDQDNDDYYQRLRIKFRKWASTDEGKNNKFAEFLMLVPDFFHLLCKLAMDKNIDIKTRGQLGLVVVYFVSPIDLIPEGIVGPVGYVDDLALTAYVLNRIINESNEEIVRNHWAGEGDVLEAIKKILKVADEMVGSGLWDKVKKVIRN